MKSRKRLHTNNRKQGGDPLQSVIVLVICGVLTLGLLVGSRLITDEDRNQVYAASDALETSSEDDEIPFGLAGVMSGVSDSVSQSQTVKKIGTSCEDVMVGQRVHTVAAKTTKLDVSSSMESKVDSLDSTASSMAATPKMMSDTDYENLLRIVEAEAGTEDIKGRVLVANVIMNRVADDEFPDTISDVIWEVKSGVAQFSPTYDGTIYTVTVSDETREAVKQALNGTDYSEGALFFIQRSAAEEHNVTWFDENLTRLFKHGVHEFYKYPEEETETK
jgi:N-acetylmuramoyl-L-alanine amidase